MDECLQSTKENYFNLELYTQPNHQVWLIYTGKT